MLTKSYLTVVATLYIGLSAWCSLDPRTTSEKVGFTRVGGSGQSEFIVIYGGLELAMALVFLIPWIDQRSTQFALWSCLLIHACLVLFRSVSFYLYDGISSMTYKLAGGEWLILLVGIVCWWFSSQQETTPS